MELQLQDKVAIVTGALRGIGLAVAQRLVAEGALVVARRVRGPRAWRPSGTR